MGSCRYGEWKLRYGNSSCNNNLYSYRNQYHYRLYKYFFCNSNCNTKAQPGFNGITIHPFASGPYNNYYCHSKFCYHQ